MSVTITRVGPADTARSFGVEHYRSAYEKGVSVSQLLERQDPSSDYADSPEGRLDAFERVMHAAGLISNPIRSYGVQASTWEEATQTAPRRALLHEFCARIWRQTTSPSLMPPTPTTRALLLSGDAAVNTLARPYTDDAAIRAPRLEPAIPIERLVARSRSIDGADYRTLYITDALGTDGYRMKRVTEGAEIPKTTLVTGEHTLRIHKHGRALLATYEQLRRLTIDRIAFIVARMALQAEVDKIGDAVDIIVSGDGNTNTAAVVEAQTVLDAGSAAGTLTLKAYLVWKSRFGPGYILDTVLAQEAATMQLLLLPVNTVNGIPMVLLPQGSIGDLRPVTNLLAGGVAWGITSDAPALQLVGFDSRFTLERVTEVGGDVSEVERFITNQTQVLTLTDVEGFQTLDTDSARILNINA